jgi:serine/threonine protein kinase
MSLPTGTRLGRFEVVAPIGSGGMGEVYRARDLELGREVALKVLPDEFAHDPSRLVRFEREARATAALNHPNILVILEVGTCHETPFVVFELLSGHTLRLLMGRPLAVRRAIDYVTQIARGLAAAHEKGVVHRDVKPENLFVTTDGRVKVLDFGIARFAGPDRNDATQATLTAPGTVIGTSGYMAPEQIRSEAVDARADIFALGAVFYEMLTARRAFPGDRPSDALAAILKEDPPAVAALNRDVPAGVARVVHRCLEKQPEERYQSARDIVFALEAVSEPVSAPPVEPRWRRLTTVAAAALAAGVLGSGITRMASDSSSPQMPAIRSVIDIPDTAPLSKGEYVPFTLSSDGTTVAYVTDQPERMFVRRLDSFEVTELAGTDGAYDPFFSPDNLWLGFWAHGEIKKVPVAGGPAVVVCQAADMLGASWGEDGSIVFAPGLDEGLFAVSAGGGTPQKLTTLDPARNDLQHAFPQIVNRGRAVLFTATARSREAPHSVELYDITTRVRRTVVAGAQYGRYLPTGHLVFVRDRTLFAVKVVEETLEPAGPPVAVLTNVESPRSGEARFSVATDGTLVYLPSQPPVNSTIVWVDRTGAATNIGLPPRPYRVPRVSPRGDAIAVLVEDSANTDVWIAPFGRPPLERLTFGRRALFTFPAQAFFPDGTRVTYSEDTPKGARLVTHGIDGSQPPHEVLNWARRVSPGWVTHDETLLLNEFGATTGADILVMRPGVGAAPTPFVQDPGNQWGPALSPDERYVAYASEETGRYEIFVTPFPGPGPKRQVTTEGGTEVTWSRDGHEIFYRSSGRMMAIPVSSTMPLQIGASRLLFEDRYAPGAAGLPAYDVGADGRFLMMRTESAGGRAALRLVSNWFAELTRLVP